MVEPEAPPFEEERFGPYVLKRELASGGMATVYEARRIGDEGFERRVAIKRIHPHLAKDRAFVAMFLDEARIAARIAHPNVCQVLDYGRLDGASYLAMEYLDGHSVSEVLAALARADEGGDAHVRLAATVILEAAEGLHAAHELTGADGALLDVVHRDVSPQNLFVTLDGEVKVLDFGVATARDKTHHTETGELKGKLAYMAPEQIAGRVDRRADVWALGVVAWELLVLRRLFRRGSQSETIVAVEREPIAPPSIARQGLGETFDAVVMAALARDAEQRIPTAHALGAALADALVPLGGPLSRAERAARIRALFAERGGRAEAKPRDAQAEVATLAAKVARKEAPAAEAAPVARRYVTGLIGLVLGAAGLALASALFVGSQPESSDAIATVASPIDAGGADAALDAWVEPPDAGIDAPVRAEHAEVRAELRAPARPTAERETEVPLETPEVEVPTAGEGTTFVRADVAFCLDTPCADRADIEAQGHLLRLPAGSHRLFYIANEGPPSGPAVTIGERTIVIAPGPNPPVPRVASDR